MMSSENAFSPDNEAAIANEKVREDYGGESGRLTILIIAKDNVLSRASLLAQLDLEDKILVSEVSEVINGTQENPAGILSPATIVIQSIFYNN